jgi:hypothetical protein
MKEEQINAKITGVDHFIIVLTKKIKGDFVIH